MKIVPAGGTGNDGAKLYEILVSVFCKFCFRVIMAVRLCGDAIAAVSEPPAAAGVSVLNCIILLTREGMRAMYQEEYKRWLAADLIDFDLNKELRDIEGDDI